MILPLSPFFPLTRASRRTGHTDRRPLSRPAPPPPPPQPAPSTDCRSAAFKLRLPLNLQNLHSFFFLFSPLGLVFFSLSRHWKIKVLRFKQLLIPPFHPHPHRQEKEGGGGGGEQTDRDRQRKTERQRETEAERETENSNSKTLFYKDCSLGSVKNLSDN